MTQSDSRRPAVFGVGIGASALNEHGDGPALQRAAYEDLLEDLAVHGRLVFTSDEELARFVEAVRALPSTLAKAWEAVLSSRKVTVAIRDPETTPNLDELVDPQRLEQRTAPDLELVLLEDDQAEVLGVADDEFSSRTPGGLVEISRLSTAGRTATIMAAKKVLMAPLREGVSREVEWEERLEPLVTSSSAIVVYDKYVGTQTARRYLHGQEGGDGLTWRLTWIGRHPHRRVRVITATMDKDRRGRVFDERALAAAFQVLHEEIDRRVSLDLVFVLEKAQDARGRTTEKFGHDRHVRFSERTALALGVGIQSFSRAKFIETITVARLPIPDAKDREERATRAAVRPPRGGWLNLKLQSASDTPTRG